MVSIEVGERPHAVCIPSPFQGHINAMLKMAKILYTKGFRITFVHNESNYNRIVSSGSSESSSLGAGLDNFRFETVQSEVNYTSATVTEEFRDPVRSLLSRLNGDPPVTCIVTDSFMSFNLGFAAEMGVPSVYFCSVSACSFMGFLHYKELLQRGIVPFRSESDLTNEYLDTVVEWIPGMKNMRLRDLPSFIRTTDPNMQPLFHFCKNESQAAFQATTIVMHTFDELEGPVIDALSSILPSPVYSIGPLNLLCSKINDDNINNIGNSFWKEDSSFMDWLGRRKSGSVIYVNFGSLTSMTSEQLLEVAWGIANSGHDFLWVIRPDMVEGGASGINLPSEFLSETDGRGLLTSWCVQEKVLRHPSIGGFFTHCGWNSMMDAISAGVPMMCWPQVGDQPTNCRYACTEWGIGMEIDANVKRKEVEEVIRELMGGGKGKEMKRKAVKWKESAIRATEPGGKSSLGIERLLKEVMLK